MNILITGENGFIAKNLSLRLKEFNYSISGVNKLTSNSDLNNKLEKADFIFLAGENRSEDSSDFEKNNHLFTKNVCNFLSKRISRLQSYSPHQLRPHKKIHMASQKD